MMRHERDGMDLPKALILNIITSVLLSILFPHPFKIPVIGFMVGYYLAEPFELLDKVRRFLNG